MSTVHPEARPADVGPTNWRQIALITAVAIALYAAFRLAPTGTNLSHMDFRVGGEGAIDFCDPLNPQFIPVVAMRSPVTMTLTTKTGAAVTGEEGAFAVTLKTSSGKRIEPVDLLVTHTERLHLLVVDPTLTDYQHVHPTPSPATGEWLFSFTPRGTGTYRVFGDFTPAATARGLYASVDLQVAGGGKEAPAAAVGDTVGAVVDEAGYRFELRPASPVRATQAADLFFTIHRPDGGGVALEPVMGAFAHLVAFDEARSGFAHLHPTEADLLARPDALRPQLSFKITIPEAGRYVVWAQVNIGGREMFVPFWLDVTA